VKRSAGLKRSGFKNPRKPMKRGSLDKALKAYHGFGPRTAPMKRGKALGPGKKKLAQKAATVEAILAYFDRFGWLNDEGQRMAPCQMTGDAMHLGGAIEPEPHTQTEEAASKSRGCHAPQA